MSNALTDEQIEEGWHATFSTSNPHCPCNLKSFTKAVRWAEHAVAALPSDAAQAPEPVATVVINKKGDPLRGISFLSLNEHGRATLSVGKHELYAAPVAADAAAPNDTCACGYSLETSCNVLDPTCKRNAAQPDERAAFSKDSIREIFMAHGFTIKEGQTDLKQYVYDAAYALLVRATAPQATVKGDERASEVYAECRQCDECGHIGINDSHETDAACGHSCGWRGPSPEEDKCPGCGNTNVMSIACPKCSSHYNLLAEARLPARAAVPQAGAPYLPCPICKGVEGCDHTVPERRRAAVPQPSLPDAAITACALMIKGICMTHPQEQWSRKIEERIRCMLGTQP